MGIFLQYIRLEIKKSCVALFHMILGMVAMLVGTFALVVCVSQVVYHTNVFEPITVAFVVPGEQSEVQMATRVVGMTDSVKSICDFVYQDEEEAMEALEEGSLQAAILLGEDFYSDVVYGTNTPIKVVIRKDSVFRTGVFRELLQDGISLADTSEAGIYAVTDTAEIYQMQVSRRDMEYYLTDLYLNTAMAREKIFVTNVLMPLGQLNIWQYYASVGVAILMMFWGLSFGFLYRKQDQVVEQKLKVYGIGTIQTSLVKIMIMTVILWLLELFVLFLLLFVDEWTGVLYMDVHMGNVVLCLIPAFSVAGFLHMIYSLSQQRMHTGMLVVLLGLFMMITSGCLIPAMYLPKVLRVMGACMPLTFWRESVANAIFIFDSVWKEGIAFILGVVFIVIGDVVQWKQS